MMVKAPWIAVLVGAVAGILLLIKGFLEGDVMHVAAYSGAACAACVIPYVVARALGELLRKKKTSAPSLIDVNDAHRQ